MFCHPDSIRKKSKFEKYMEAFLKGEDYKKFEKSGIYDVPTNCSYKCRYWKECVKEAKILHKK